LYSYKKSDKFINGDVVRRIGNNYVTIKRKGGPKNEILFWC